MQQERLTGKSGSKEFKYAYIEPVGQKKPEKDGQEIQDSGYAAMPAEKGRLHPRVHHNTEET
jgi:hypothetical protein